MNLPLTILFVGIGGYGSVHVEEVLNRMCDYNVSIAGVVDPVPEKSRFYEKLKNMNIPFFTDINDFYLQHKADIAVISSPIQCHHTQTCTALLNGSHVMCEKPISGSVKDALDMISVKNKTRKLLAIGYQRSFQKSTLDLKRDILAGRLGKPIRMKTIISWPRNKQYYNRNSWAGKFKDNQGNWIRDSIAHNGTAHFIHNMFFLLGDKMDSSAMPESVQAELYRANDIETFDTAAARIITENNVEVLYYATHAAKEDMYQYIFEFSDCTVFFDSIQHKRLIATFNDGSIIDYGYPENYEKHKLWSLVDAIRGQGEIYCGPEAALPQVICIEAMHDSTEPVTFISDIIRFDEEMQLTWVDGLYDGLFESYRKGKLPSENKIDWAHCGKTISVCGYLNDRKADINGGK